MSALAEAPATARTVVAGRDARAGRGAAFRRAAVGLILPLAVALAWEAATRAGLAEGRLIPPPSVVFRTLVALVEDGQMAAHIPATLSRVALGFALGVAAGTIVGAAAGYVTLIRRLLDPTLQALRNIPSIAWVPLFILWFGIFETSKILLIAVGVFFPIYLNLTSAVLGVDRKLVEVGRMFRLSHRQMVFRVLLPAVLPAYMVALRSGLGLGWMFVVAAEFMGAEEGLGFLLTDGQQTGRPAVILASIVTFAVLGKATDWVLAALSTRLTAWRDSFKTED